MQPARIETLTEQEYLEGETLGHIKHEYVDGQVFAMSGTTLAHNTIAANMIVMLHGHLRGRPCRAFIADVKVRIATQLTYYYPDVVVTCDPRDLTAVTRHFVEHPVLIIEVLSLSTKQIDRREKLTAYRRLPSLVEYVLVDQKRRAVDVYRKVGETWTHGVVTDGEVLELASVGWSGPVADLYEDSGLGGPRLR